MISLIDNNTVALLSLALDATTMRHQAIAHNIANANTPGYKPVGVSFETYLADARNALAEGRPISFASVSDVRPAFEVVESDGLGSGAVSLDTEVAQMSENALHHQVLLKALNRHFSILNMAMGEGKH